MHFYLIILYVISIASSTIVSFPALHPSLHHDHIHSLLQLITIYNTNVNELYQKITQWRNEFFPSDYPVPFVNVVQYCESEIIFRRIWANPIDHRAKIWQNHRHRFLKYFYSKDELKQDDARVEAHLHEFLAQKIESYLTKSELQTDPMRSGELFRLWMIRKSIRADIFLEDVITVMRRFSTESPTEMNKEKAFQIYVYLDFRKYQPKYLDLRLGRQFIVKWNAFQASKVESLRNLDLSRFENSPMPLVIENTMYLVCSYIGKGSFGIAYEGYRYDNPEKPLIFKILLDGLDSQELSNEVTALTLMGRLIDYNYIFGLIVQKKMPGESFQALMPKLLQNREELHQITSKYLLLNEQFFKKTRLIHNDIAPRNVIIDPDTKELYLIDFGLSRPASFEKEIRKRELKASKDNAEFALIKCMLYSQLQNALMEENENPREAIKILEQLIEIHRAHNRSPEKYVDMIKALKEKLRDRSYMSVMERWR